MEPINITKSFKEGVTQEVITKVIIANNGHLSIIYSMQYINFSQSPIDIIHNYIEAAYITEELGKLSTSIQAKIISRDPYPPNCQIELRTDKIEEVSRRVFELSIALSDESYNDDVHVDYEEELFNFKESLDDRQFYCPDLMDGYYANLVTQAYDEIDANYDKNYSAQEYRKYPERKYGFWKSAYSPQAGFDFYVSTFCWIVSIQEDIYKLISEYSGIREIEEFEDSQRFSLDEQNYLINTKCIIPFSPEQLLSARKCAATITLHDEQEIAQIENDLYTLSQRDEFIEQYFWHLIDDEKQVSFSSSASGSVLIARDKSYHYVFFPRAVNEDRLLQIYQRLSNIFFLIGQVAGINQNISLPWEKLDEEKFEDLCYDVIFHDSRYDEKTIRKMGKTKSRDGGRDIMVYTREKFGIPRKLYIFQCKYSKVNSSLSAQKVINISDVIVQYGAQGYGVMTPVVIDATLYDRIDGICKNINISSDNWSVLELERFLAKHPKLRARYFPN